MENETKFLILSNPFMWPIEIGVFTAVVLKNLFGGVYNDCKKILGTL